MEIPIPIKHILRLVLLIALLAEGTNQNRNLVRLQKAKAAGRLESD